MSDRKPAPPRVPAILEDPIRNRGVAFSAEERDRLGLTGQLPPAVLTLDQQSQRVYTQLESQPANVARIFLERLHDRNETLYFKVLSDHLAELLPVVEGGAADEAIGRYPDEYGSPRGIYLSIDRPGDIERSFATLGLGASDVDVIVCSDGEKVPGIGDWGAGGIRTAMGKLAVYTAGAGIHPHRMIPVSLDAGTDSETLLSDPFYLGNRHARRRDQDYDAFIERYVQTVSALFPDALLHFEDLSAENARKVLRTYGHRYRAFTGHLQGTGAVVLAAVYAAIRVTGIPMKHQELVVFGPGAAGVGIADQLRAAMTADGATDEQARSQIWLADTHGLLFDDMDDLRDFQRDYAKQRSSAPGASGPGPVRLADIIAGVAPTILLGTSGLRGAFTQEVIQAMCQATRRPLILPLAAPAAAIEAMPADIIAWSGGKALMATGIPASPVEWNGTTFTIGQMNNVLVYPGIGLGIIVSRAVKVTPHMLQAAAAALAEQVDASQPGAPLLPGIKGLPASSALVAEAIVHAAVADQVASYNPTNPTRAVHDAMWRPAYPDPG
jgi:malate dehydrogenase (oxaloacetate-decarboxylating)